MDKENKVGQRSQFPTRKGSTQENVGLLDFRVRNGNGYDQAAMAVLSAVEKEVIYKPFPL